MEATWWVSDFHHLLPGPSHQHGRPPHGRAATPEDVRVADGWVVDGPVADGLVAGGPVAGGWVVDGQVADGWVSGGQVVDGLVVEDWVVEEWVAGQMAWVPGLFQQGTWAEVLSVLHSWGPSEVVSPKWALPDFLGYALPVQSH